MVVNNTIDKDTEEGSAAGKAPPTLTPHSAMRCAREYVKTNLGRLPSKEKTPYAWSG